MTHQDLVNLLVAKLKIQLPIWFQDLNQVCASNSSGHNRWLSQLPYHDSLEPVTDNINRGLLNENYYLEGVCGCIRLNLYRSVAYAYLGMKCTDVDAAWNSISEVLTSSLIELNYNAIIVSFGVDFWGLHPKGGFVLDAATGTWSFNKMPIYEIPMLSVPKELDRTIFVIKKEDAPCWDANTPYCPSLHMDGAIAVNDPLMSTEIWVGRKKNEVDEGFLVNHILPLVYKSAIDGFRIRVTKYNYEDS